MLLYLWCFSRKRCFLHLRIQYYQLSPVMYPEDHKPVTTNAEQMFISCWKEMNSSRVVAGFTGALAALRRHCSLFACSRIKSHNNKVNGHDLNSAPVFTAGVICLQHMSQILKLDMCMCGRCIDTSLRDVTDVDRDLVTDSLLALNHRAELLLWPKKRLRSIEKDSPVTNWATQTSHVGGQGQQISEK